MIKTLLVDTNRAAYPIYQALCARGHDVWVVGGNPNETLAKLATNYVQLDYSDRDKLDAFVTEQDFNYLVPGCTDLSYQVCAQINNGRFPGLDTTSNTDAINVKSQFRQLAATLNFPVPQVLSLEQAAGEAAIIVKPVDSFSGRGVSVLHEPTSAQLTEAYDAACQSSNSGTALVEEFVSGQLYSHSAFVRGGEVVADFIVQEDCVASPFAVDTSRVVERFSAQQFGRLRRDVCRLAAHLELQDGLVHTQFIANEDRYWVIEMTRRCPGDIYALLIEFSTGYPYAASYAAPFVGEQADAQADVARHSRIIRHTVSSMVGTSLWGVSFSRPVDIRLFVPLATAGDCLAAGPQGRAGIFFFRASSAEDEQALYLQLLRGQLYSFN